MNDELTTYPSVDILWYSITNTKQVLNKTSWSHPVSVRTMYFQKILLANTLQYFQPSKCTNKHHYCIQNWWMEENLKTGPIQAIKSCLFCHLGPFSVLVKNPLKWNWFDGSRVVPSWIKLYSLDVSYSWDSHLNYRSILER